MPARRAGKSQRSGSLSQSGVVLEGMSRRGFLARAINIGLLSALSVVRPRESRSDPLGLPIGIQLWTVQKPMLLDPAGTLGRLREIGYRTVETAGLGNSSAKDFRALLDHSGLQCPSAHLDFTNGDVDALLAEARILGAQFVVSSLLRHGTGQVPELPTAMKKYQDFTRDMTLDDARRTAEIANRLGEKAKQAGLRYAYHNHFIEFADQGSGKVAYDVLLQETDPTLVDFELDCGWMMAAGRSPVEYLKRYPHRFPMLHVKDFMPAPHGADTRSPALRTGTELGRGQMNYRPIFAAARGNLQYYFCEQEGPFDHIDELQAAKINFDYLHRMR
jgi:sugar phosphate isomerase/epimerase